MPRAVLRAALSIAALFGSATSLGAAGLWLDVPYVRQLKNGCGAATIAMVMQYWERRDNLPIQPAALPAQIFRAVYSPSAHGVYASAMVGYFQANGYRAFAFAGQPADIERQLAQGRPLIVALKPGSSLHYVVVAGLDPSRQLVLVNDPAGRKLLKEDQSQFDREWNAAGRWLLLAVPDLSSH